jgi:hypothetical protein
VESKQCSNRELIARTLKAALSLADGDVQLAQRIREAIQYVEWLSALDALPDASK